MDVIMKNLTLTFLLVGLLASQHPVTAYQRAHSSKIVEKPTTKDAQGIANHR